ncbi:MAG TPA: hemolysin III family protein [Pyrinomonadaceae bacterium]|nr:hemolysin III family protein [Pyrinomonadaceae bacterium]
MDNIEKIEEEIGWAAEKLSVEEVANTITHGLGLGLSVIGAIVLMVLALANGDKFYIIANVIYGVSLMLLYAASTFYHGVRSPRLKKAFHFTDHAGIYLLTAGTYTPFVLVTLRGGTFGWTIFFIVWSLAFTFIILRIFFGERFPVLWVLSYLLLGWIGVVLIQPLFTAVGWGPIVLVMAGGLAYSLGVVFYAAHRIPHNHAIWHVFVMAGSLLHYLAIVLYVRPAA